MKIFFFLGPPGSGKGTQIGLLAKKLGLFHFVTSAVGREYIEKHPDDPETIRQKALYEKGMLWDSDWMMKISEGKIEEIIKTGNIGAGIIFDGLPRTLPEAERLLDICSKLAGKENVEVIALNVPEEELLSRIEKRLICNKEARHVFIKSEVLQKGNICPEGDGILIERNLDKVEIFKTRMKEYKDDTVPSIEYLKKHHKVLEVDGNRPIEIIHAEIMEKLGYDNY